MLLIAFEKSFVLVFFFFFLLQLILHVCEDFYCYSIGCFDEFG